MTATDPHPGLAAMLVEKLTPAAEALAGACAEDMNAGPPPEDDRALAERHRAGRAALSHLRQLLGVLDRAAAHLPEPEQVPAGEPGSGYDGSENVYYFGKRQYVVRLTTPEFRDWLARQERREAADMAAREAAGGSAGAGAGGESRNRAASSFLPSRSAGGAGGGPLGATGLCRASPAASAGAQAAPLPASPASGRGEKRRPPHGQGGGQRVDGAMPGQAAGMSPAHADHDIS